MNGPKRIVLALGIGDSLDEKARRELDDAAKQDIQRTRDGFRAAVDRETLEFNKVARELHEKNMALAVAETRYAKPK